MRFFFLICVDIKNKTLLKSNSTVTYTKARTETACPNASNIHIILTLFKTKAAISKCCSKIKENVTTSTSVLKENTKWQHKNVSEENLQLDFFRLVFNKIQLNIV